MTVFSLKRWFDSFRGIGEAAVTIPSMDGALRPNSLLDEADVAWSGQGAALSNLATDGKRAFFSSGQDIFEIAADGEARPVSGIVPFEGRVASLALHPSGLLAIGLVSGGIVLHHFDGVAVTREAKIAPELTCPAAMAFADADTLIVANGSASNAPADWCRDLMEKGRSGSLWRVALKTASVERIAGDLGYPAGVVLTADGDIIVSESWRHRLLRVRSGRENQVLLDDLPGYPGALSRAASGGYWLSIFAPRRQLIEFVLREDAYRERMLATVDQQYWIAPALRSGENYLEPVQTGGVRHLGMVKPWAPTRSYGLLVRLDDMFMPVASYHSRADARRHGITSAVDSGDRVLVTCAALGQVLALDPDRMEE